MFICLKITHFKFLLFQISLARARGGGPCLLAVSLGIRLWAQPLPNAAEGPATRGRRRAGGEYGKGHVGTSEQAQDPR